MRITFDLEKNNYRKYIKAFYTQIELMYDDVTGDQIDKVVTKFKLRPCNEKDFDNTPYER